jgi:CO/xanthine dehydrogenase Mo-binding subunit
MTDLAGVNGTRKDFRVVGKPNLPGVLSWSQATGVAKFGIDYVVPDMLEAKFLRSPYANAYIKAIDTTKARAIPGVVDIITWQDKDIKNLSGGDGGGITTGPPQAFLDNIADQEGAEIGVIVVAENEDICAKALRALDVVWEVLPHIVDLRKGWEPDTPLIRPTPPYPGAGGDGGGFRPGGGTAHPPKKGNVSYSNVSEGNIEAGFREADHIIEYDVNTAAFSGHIPNPTGSVAWWFDDAYHGDTKSLRIEGIPAWTEDSIADMYHISPEKIFREGMFLGGRYCDWGNRKTQLVTPILAKRTGRPVRCVNNRYEMYDFNLNQRYVHLKVGFKSNGLITAIDDFSIADSGVRGSSIFGNALDQTFGPYFTTRCRNVKQNMEIVDSNRGKMYLSGQHNPMTWDSLMVGLYLIAEKLGKDPIDIATLNLHGPTSQEDPNPVPSYEACVAAVKKIMNWNWHQAGARKLPDGRLHGASFRYNQCPRHSGMTYNTKLELRNGVVHLATQGPLIGHFGLEANAMVVAEEIGLAYENIRIDFDSHEIYRPYGGGSDGSTASSWAMKECANKLKKLILETAIEEANNPPAPAGMGGMMGGLPKQPSNPFRRLKPEDLDMQGGKVIIKANPSSGLPLAQAVQANLFATFSGKPPAAVWTQRGKALDVMNVATCEVAVDTETGEVEILRFGVVADPGKILRRTSLESQIDQVMDFTKGCQLQEEFIYDPKTGVILSTNMFDYRKISMLDMPRVDLELLETRGSNACYGASGISHSLANTHLVIMAIHNAIDKWVESPATPEKVLKALGKG